MTQSESAGSAASGALLEQFSDQLAGVVRRAATSVVRVDDNSRLTASGIVWPATTNEGGADAIVAATSHGVEDDDNVAVIDPSTGERLAAIVAGRDPESDIAVLRVPGAAGRLTPAALAPADSVAVGQIALALGRPGEFGLRATFGIVSARYDALENGRGEYIAHTDATLFPGSSGGALVNARGEVIGLLNLAFRRTGGVALGADMVSHVAEALLAGGSVGRGYLGVGTQPVELTEAQAQAAGSPYALLVVHVEPGSPAAESGLMIGDLLTAIAGQPLDSRKALRSTLRRMVPGSAIKITLLRGGTPTELDATIGEEK